MNCRRSWRPAAPQTSVSRRAAVTGIDSLARGRHVKAKQENADHRNRQRIDYREGSSGLILRAMSSGGPKAFIARWAAASASERANSPPFLCGLC
ncbi:MAG: hypothetical protein WCK27_03130, partial [Verrucomicrobiota bacterium]